MSWCYAGRGQCIDYETGEIRAVDNRADVGSVIGFYMSNGGVIYRQRAYEFWKYIDNVEIFWAEKGFVPPHFEEKGFYRGAGVFYFNSSTMSLYKLFCLLHKEIPEVVYFTAAYGQIARLTFKSGVNTFLARALTLDNWMSEKEEVNGHVVYVK